MAARKPESHHVAPRCLLGEGIQAWVEWEMEAMRWRVPVDISRADLEALVDWSPRTSSKSLETISNGEERA